MTGNQFAPPKAAPERGQQFFRLAHSHHTASARGRIHKSRSEVGKALSKMWRFLEETARYLDAVRRFARDDLGCECLDEVFDQVRILTRDAAPGEARLAVVIGERLLVVFARPEDVSPLERNLPRLLLSCVTYRDSAGLSRFRLVLTGEYSDQEKGLIEQHRAGFDDRVHVHYLV